MAGFFSTISDNLLMEQKSAVECIETISESVETQKLVENVLKSHPDIPSPVNNRTSIPEIKPESERTNNESIPACAASICEDVYSKKKDSSELKTPTHFSSQSEFSSKIQNTVPLKWESPLLQALRTTSPDPDTFSMIPQKRSLTPLASALTIAPQESFTPVKSHLEIVPLPEETVPYFPPERPILPVKEEEPEEPPAPEVIECKPSRREKPISRFVKALEQAPERPSPVGGVSVLPRMKAKQNEKGKKTTDKLEDKPTVKPEEKPKPIFKKNDPFSKYFEDLPKPLEKLSLSSALTIAPDRPYSPLIVESVGLEMAQVSKISQDTTKSTVTKPLRTAPLPESFKVNLKESRPPGYYPPNAIQSVIEENISQKSSNTALEATKRSEVPVCNNPGPGPSSVYYQRAEQNIFEEEKKESETTQTRSIERQAIQNPQVSQILTSEKQTIQYAPIFQGFSCSFQNKTDRSQINVHISTTPPLINAPPTQPTITTIESKPGYIEKEVITEEKRDRLKTSTKKQEGSEEIQYAKQSEEVILRKAEQPVRLHKPEAVPQYQVQIKDEAEADIQFMEKVEKAQIKLEQQKQEIIRQETVKKPIIMIQQDEVSAVQSQNSFKPVTEDRHPNQTFSPRPGSISPSMINKPPPALPYYQANLVPQQMEPPKVQFLDPTSPATSRSPSPCPVGRRSPCPGGGASGQSTSPSLPRTGSNIRPVSPAQGPPPNPLRSPKPLPTPDDTKREQARENLSTFIPEYRNKRDMIEKVQGKEIFQKTETDQPTQMYTSTVKTQSFPADLQHDYRHERSIATNESIENQHQLYQKQMLDIQEVQKSERHISQSEESTISKSIREQSRLAHLEQMQKSQSQSVEMSADGLTQIQRKKVVTEEYGRTQKETNIQIEKNQTRSTGFQRINVPETESPVVMGMHVTNPHPITSSCRQHIEQQQTRSELQSSVQKTSSQSHKSSHAVVAAQTSVQPSLSFPTLLPSNTDEPTLPSAIKKVYDPSAIAPVKHVSAPATSSSKKNSQNITVPDVSPTDTGAAGGRQAGGISVAPRRGRGVLNAAALGGARIPLCGSCNMQIRGPFITALGKIWCPNHFICATPSCRRPLQDLGFVEEKGQLYCEYCFEQYLAPPCAKCSAKIKGDCLKAIGKNFHPECFNCVYCGKLFGNSPFFLEDGSPYCEADWNELFTTKCFACGFPVEAGDRWVEALNNNYHSQCFNCTMCKKNLEGQSFFAKGGRPFCKNHAR